MIKKIRVLLLLLLSLFLLTSCPDVSTDPEFNFSNEENENNNTTPENSENNENTENTEESTPTLSNTLISDSVNFSGLTGKNIDLELDENDLLYITYDNFFELELLSYWGVDGWNAETSLDTENQDSAMWENVIDLEFNGVTPYITYKTLGARYLNISSLSFDTNLWSTVTESETPYVNKVDMELVGSNMVLAYTDIENLYTAYADVTNVWAVTNNTLVGSYGEQGIIDLVSGPNVSYLLYGRNYDEAENKTDTLDLYYLDYNNEWIKDIALPKDDLAVDSVYDWDLDEDVPAGYVSRALSIAVDGSDDLYFATINASWDGVNIYSYDGFSSNFETVNTDLYVPNISDIMLESGRDGKIYLMVQTAIGLDFESRFYQLNGDQWIFLTSINSNQTVDFTVDSEGQLYFCHSNDMDEIFVYIAE